MDSISLLIAVEVRLYAEGLSASLTRFPGLYIVGCAQDTDTAFQLLREQDPQVVLLDPGMRRADELVKEAGKVGSQARFVALGIREVEDDVIACAELGCVGYVPRDESLAELAAAIVRTARGELNCSPRIAASLFRRVAAMRLDAPRSTAAANALTRREGEIVGLVEKGLSNKQIASRLKISTSTVKSHVHNILGKLNVTRRGAAAAAIRTVSL